MSFRNYSPCISLMGRLVVPRASAHPELQNRHHTRRLQHLGALGSPAASICLGGAIKPPTHFSSCHLPHLLPCVHQPPAHRNHTNSEIDLLKSTQSISIGTHTISLQMAKMNLKHCHYYNATGITAVCVGLYKK